MAMSPAGISVFGLILLSSLSAVPLTGPPLPVDPALAAVAPRQCLWYASSAGVTKPDPNSENQTEQLFAEPEIRHFTKSLEEQILRALRRGAGSGREERVLSAELPKLFKALMTQPLAAFVEDFQITDDGFSLQAGLVLHADEQRAEIESAINELVELASSDGAPVGSLQKDGEMWSVVRLSMQTPEIRWGWQGNYFILAVGDDMVETILSRLQGTAPDWLMQLRQNQPFQRESSIGYFNVELLLDRLQPMLEKQEGWEIVEKLGLTSIESCHSMSGFDKLGCVTVAHLKTDGQRRGLLSLLPDKQLSDDDLTPIPADAMIAAAVRIDIHQTWKNLIRLVEDFDPRTADQMQRGLWEAETELGVNIQDDVLGSFDDVWTAYLPAGDLMTSWLSSALAVKVKDAPRLQSAVHKIVDYAKANLPERKRGGAKIREASFEGQTIYTLNVVGEPVPVAPSWCVTEDWLFVGLTPQTVRGLVARNSSPDLEVESLNDRPEIKLAFSGTDAPTSITYFDTPKLVRSLYPLVQIGAQMVSSQLQREGFDLDTSILPSSDSIIRHLRPSTHTMASRNDGVYFYSQSSLPAGGSATVLAPLAVGTMLPAVTASRTAARRVQGLNNMKQIALAFHNYVDVNGKFPTNVYDDEGKALLSWRVRLLPYLELQADLGDEFHLDEPWDSPHNRRLSEKIVPVFSSPDEPSSNRTRYLALVSEETIFPGDEKLSFRNVRDGTSQTIMFVEAAPSRAVPWTQPQDIDFDPKQPFAGLSSPEGRFAIAMTDGSCRWLNQSIGEEAMRELATRAGGEVIDQAVFNR